MSQDNYGVEDSYDEDNQQIQASSYGAGQSEQQAQDADSMPRSDKDQDDMENQDDQIQSVHSVQEEVRHQIIQEDEPQFTQPNTERITSPFMTKYQKARIIGVRAMQISKNSPLYLTADSNSLMNWDPLTIAEKELAEKKIPFIIRRYLPDGSFQDWKLSQLKTFD